MLFCKPNKVNRQLEPILWTSDVEIFLAAFVAFALVIVGMAVGVIFAGKRIQGSCGGLSAWTDENERPMCEACLECPAKKSECELENRTHRAAYNI